mmetsp:Transcript_18590/g.26453  ORF Transcript_18590/g.26453 Transcript_18590/m.26453 type:complete len:429 (+) Transcript_18590:47-1333(+)
MIQTLKTQGLRAISGVTTLIGGAIVVLGISSQPVMSLFCGSIPNAIAWIITLGAFYYAYTVGLLSYIIGFVIVCAACGIIGSPHYIMSSIFGPKPPEPKVKMVKIEASVKPKKSWVTRFFRAITRPFVRLTFLVLAILETIVYSSFFEKENCGETKAQRSWFWNQLYEKDEAYYNYEEVYGGEVQNDHPEELWIHINGILNDADAAKDTCKVIYEMFGRPCKLLHNPTDGPILDLLECFMGKTGLLRLGCTGPRKLLRNILREEMKKDYKKIVLIAHSQGTIITGNVIADFNDMIEDEEMYSAEERGDIQKNVSKLEVYLLAGAAHYVSGKYVSHLECLSNRGDVVAVLGHIFPNNLKGIWRNTRGNGIRYEHCKDLIEYSNWGHTCTDHYFAPMEKGSFSESKLVTDYWLKNPERKSETETSPLVSK